MMITKQMQKKISEQIGETPMTADEIRRIPGLGNLYMSARRELADKENYRYLYSVKINEIRYHFFTSLDGVEN